MKFILKIKRGLIAGIVFCFTNQTLLPMEQQEEIKKSEGWPPEQIFQPKSLAKQSSVAVYKQIVSLYNTNQFDVAIEKIIQLPDELKYQIVLKLVENDLQFHALYFWKIVSRKNILHRSEKLNHFLLKLAKKKNFDGLAELITFQSQNIRIIELIKEQELIDNAIAAIDFLNQCSEQSSLRQEIVTITGNLQKFINQITSEEVKKALNQYQLSIVSKNDIPNPLSVVTTILLSFPMQLIHMFFQTLLSRVREQKIWVDPHHLIPENIRVFDIARSYEQTQYLIIILEKLLKNKTLNDLQKKALVALMFKNELALVQVPLLVDYVLSRISPAFIESSTSLSDILSLLIQHASHQAQFDALYYSILSIIQEEFKSTIMQEKYSDTLELLLQSGVNPNVPNDQEQTLLPILMAWYEQPEDTISFEYENKKVQIHINKERLMSIIELLQQYSNLTKEAQI